ncbi:MAG: type II toxin-antitoxin system RnlB family antitoxin, partial [Christensenellaceae bacterium]|nr:type II toxin-antitoxin system RnlB family antitoxin [Christensenellaceae bacterium]
MNKKRELGYIKIKEINKDYAKYLVFSVSCESVFDEIKWIEKKINDKNDCMVLFDKLVQCFNGPNRFILVPLRKGKFVMQQKRVLDQSLVGDDIRAEISDVLRGNEILLTACNIYYPDK